MVTVRTLAFATLCYILNLVYGVSINPVLAAISFATGGLFGLYCHTFKLRNLAAAVLGCIVTVLLILVLYLISSSIDLVASSASDYFFSFKLYSIVFIYSVLSAAICATYSVFLIIEGFLFVAFLALALEEARNLNLSVSKFIYDYSSLLGIKDITFISALGGALGFAYLIWIFFQIRSHKNYKGILGWSLVALILAFIVSFGVANRVEKLSRESPMGVGFEDNEEQTPLSFDSFVGTSQQATSLVKLSKTYFDPRTSPMLYLREAALSKFNGRELVKSEFDNDTPKNPPSAPQEISVPIQSTLRTPLSQEVFLLISHSVPFSVDLGFRFNPINNPNPKKFFGGAYSALSAAPIFSPEALLGVPLGSKSWSSQEWQHYTAKHPDPRYTQLAENIARFATTPLERIESLISYINKNYIYTVKPNHKVNPGDDPVAPFLFGDRRGYCVHIAHSLVYLFRSLDIPSRIGVGYATDLSQSKDGYILLRMNDRHAWPEVYFDGVGWVIFDAYPEQVESHVEAPVDENLLRSLIDEVENRSSDTDSGVETEQPVGSSLGWFMLATGIAAYLLLKAYLWFGLIIFRDKYHLALSILSQLYDTGSSRNESEPLEVFISRLEAGDDVREQVLRLFFGKASRIDEYPKISLWRYLIGFLNPKSAFRYLVLKQW